MNNSYAYLRSFSRNTNSFRIDLYRYQKGSAAVEYSIVTLAVITALFIPLNGDGSLTGVGSVSYTHLTLPTKA